jgi:hypothetical protein
MCDSTVGYIRSSRSSHTVDPCINIRVYLWIYTGAEHWINRAILLVVVVVVYDGKPPLRGRWVSLSILIYRFEVDRVCADSETGDSMGRSHRLVPAVVYRQVYVTVMR